MPSILPRRQCPPRGSSILSWSHPVCLWLPFLVTSADDSEGGLREHFASAHTVLDEAACVCRPGQSVVDTLAGQRRPLCCVASTLPDCPRPPALSYIFAVPAHTGFSGSEYTDPLLSHLFTETLTFSWCQMEAKHTQDTHTDRQRGGGSDGYRPPTACEIAVLHCNSFQRILETTKESGLEIQGQFH